MALQIIRDRHIIEWDDQNGVTHALEDKTYTVSNLSDLHIRPVDIAASSNNQVIWDPTDQPASVPISFNYLYMRSTIELLCALTIDEDDDQGRVTFGFKMEPNQGFSLGTSFGLADGNASPPTSDIFGVDGLDDVIDRIEVEERNGVAGQLLLVLGKV